MSYARTITVTTPFDSAVEQARAAFADQGFGILSEIDVAATLRAKLQVEGEPYLILGACNPQLAYRALAADPHIGLLLPCNVVVRAEGPRTVVEALDPLVIAEVADNSEIRDVAEEAGRRIDAALEAIAAQADAS